MVEWTIDGEEVLLQTPAAYASRPGTLFLTNRRVAWYQSTARAPQLSLPLVFLAGPPKRNKGAEAHLLRCVPQAPVKGKADFTFACASARERDCFLEATARLVGAVPVAAASASSAASPAAGRPEGPRESRAARAVRESTAAARRRATALAGDAELRALYDELVGGGVVGEEEFWAVRADQLDRQTGQGREAGPPSQLVGDVRPTAIRGAEVHYRLTAAAIRQIFAERPAVRRAYEAHVPHEMSEEDFWRAYLQSRYVEGTRSTATVGDMFARAEAELAAEEERERERKGPERPPTSFDLTAGEGEDGAEGAAAEADEPPGQGGGGRSAAVAALAARLNAHGARVLEGAGKGLHDDHDDGGLIDLENPIPEDNDGAHELHLQRRKRQQRQEEMQQQEEQEERNKLVTHEEAAALRAMLAARANSKDNVVATICDSLAVPEGWHWGHRPGADDSSSSSASGAQPMDRDLSESERRAWARVHELLRHLWGCLPPADAKAVARARKLQAALLQVRPQLETEPLSSALLAAVDLALAQ